MKVQMLRAITNSYKWDAKITPELWSKDSKNAWKVVIQAIMSGTYLTCWDSRYRVYIQTNLWIIDMDYGGMQPDRDFISMTVMMTEIKGGPCKFRNDLPVDDLSQDMISL